MKQPHTVLTIFWCPESVHADLVKLKEIDGISITDRLNSVLSLVDWGTIEPDSTYRVDRRIEVQLKITRTSQTALNQRAIDTISTQAQLIIGALQGQLAQLRKSN